VLGLKSPQGELFRADHLYRDHVGEGSIYAFLAEIRTQLFHDQDFADMYRADNGRPSVPPSQLGLALLLQMLDKASDAEAIERSAYDLRWKVALGLDLEEKLCAKSTLQLFRSKLILNDRFGDLFKRSIEACQKAGLLKRKKLRIALDTTPVFGRGAVKDTFNLISDQIRCVVRSTALLTSVDEAELIEQHGLGRHFASSFKAAVDIDWSDEDAKKAVITQLVGDAKVALLLSAEALELDTESKAAQDLAAARSLLSDLLLQDIEESEDGGVKKRRGTKPDRIISTTDPEQRHGRKSASKTFNGHKAAISTSVDDGVILSTDLLPGNAHDSTGAAELAAAAGENAAKQVEEVLGDTAYGGRKTRKAIEEATGGAEVLAKTMPASKRKGATYTNSDFDIDLKAGVATCPNGKQSIRYEEIRESEDSDEVSRHRFSFSRKDCNACPMRSNCTTAKTSARRVSVSPDYEEMRKRRAEQQEPEFRERYRKRTRVEHRIGRLIQLGLRQARYFGRRKVAYQLAMTAAVANLVLAFAALESGSEGRFRPLTALLMLWTVFFVAKMLQHESGVAFSRPGKKFQTAI